ncbi:hypothetical protein PaG_02743 [Moesziomyces aphidis]|uniref:Jacalin-type lectin domain-containing protein n=1 Tax=Moesziomyces aphidis TaxID=84754 RepID=W3VMU5_MOEAP|nr:hypothetical protein PaG_02743 [Moesziomyces aphidis]
MVPPPPVPQRPSSQKFTLRFTNLQPGESVYTRLLIVEGTVGSGSPSGQLTVSHDLTSGFEEQIWEINQGYFKALVPLTPGKNDLTLNWTINGSSEHGSETVSVTYDRPSSAPPLHLVIVAACDSPVWQNDGRKPPVVPPRPSGNEATNSAQPRKADKVSRFLNRAMDRLDIAAGPRGGPVDEADRAIVDAPPGPRREALRSGGIAEVKCRIALQAYLWQAFHAEQMRRHGMGRRAFQLDDAHSDPAPGSSSAPKRALESLPHIHLLKSRRSLREFRDPENAQQKSNARNAGAMHGFAREALEDPSTPQFLRWSPVAVLTLDTMYDAKMRLIRAHAALGAGGPGSLSHGVMGSHWLWAAPSSLQQVTTAFLDTEPTDEECCVNDLNECPTAWQTLNIGSGAFFHEAGHALNNPHWPSGLMARGYVEFNRAFMTREPGCRRNGVAAGGFFAPIHAGNDDEHNHIHRAQAVRARWHPCFYIPSDPPLPYLRANDQATWVQWNENEPAWTSTPQGALLKCESGIGTLEIEVDGAYKTHIEWLNLPIDGRPPQVPPRQTVIDAAYLSQKVGFDVSHPTSPRIKLNALACNMRQAELPDFRQNGVARPLRLPGIDSSRRTIVRSLPFGQTNTSGRQWDVIFPHERDDTPHAHLVAIDIFSGASLDGLQFHYANGPRVVFGPCGGSPFRLTVDRGDAVAQIKVRAGAWIDAVEVVLRSGKTSGMRGNVTGGSLRTLEPASGEGRIVGLYGTSGAWMDSIGAYTSAPV